MNLKQALKRNKFRYYCRYNLSQTDVLLASFPKSGNTWISFVLAGLAARQVGRDVTFFNVREFVPELNGKTALSCNTPPGWPRFVKTHSPYLNFFPKAICVVRNPAEVLISYFEYAKGLGLIDQSFEFYQFCRSPSWGVRAWLNHTQSYMKPAEVGRAVQLFRYEDILKDSSGEMKRLLSIAGLPIAMDLLEAVLRYSSRENMALLERQSRRSLYCEQKSYEFVGEKERSVRRIEHREVAMDVILKTRGAKEILGALEYSY